MNNRCFHQIASVSRKIHTYSSLQSFSRESRIISKFVNPGKKRKWYESSNNTMPTVKSLTAKTGQPGKRATRRVSVLNKLFMKYITDLLSTGSLSAEVLGRGIEISKVNITQDFNIVNVYWVCKGSKDDISTEVVLNRVAGALRHELSQLRVMGEVPTIMFVKDLQHSVIVDLDKRLARADYGEDYVPKELGHILKSELVLETKLHPDIKSKIDALEAENPDFDEEPLPAMTHDVYGLQHAVIMNRLQAARNKSRQAWTRDPAASISSDVTLEKRLTDRTDNGAEYDQDKQNLSDFLLKRQIQQDRIHRQMRSNNPERELSQQLANQSHQNDNEYFIDKDFDYDDDFEEKFINSINDTYLKK